MRTRKCDAGARAGRLRKAEQFAAAARTLTDLADDPAAVGDAAVTLFVNAGIAAADVICCAVLGEYAIGDDHTQAVSLLRRADPALANSLSRLLAMKSRAAYTPAGVSATDQKVAERAANDLVQRAVEIS